MKTIKEETNNSKIPFEEKNIKITFLNKDKGLCVKIKVDDGLISKGAKGARCDYLLIKSKKKYFIELKGQDVKHAYKQLVETIDKLNEEPICDIISSNLREDGLINGFIIYKRSPLSTPGTQNLKKNFRKKYHSNLTIQKTGYKHDI